MIKIDVGAGKEPKAGYIPVDLYFTGPGYIQAPIWLLPWNDGEVDEVWCSHTLEHVEKRKVLPSLKEFHRVLKEGGVLTIEVPDLRWCCENWLAHQNSGWDLDAIFGNQDPPGGQIHMTGFSPDMMRAYLWQAGFYAVTITPVTNHNQLCIHVETFK